MHRALQYQIETKRGEHTARSGLFLRDFPGRLVLYPLEAATCAVIFFGGDWGDGLVAALCGLVAGLLDMGLRSAGDVGAIVLDVVVGTSTGAIAGLLQRYTDGALCLSSIFLGTLYWFFYGTAFVIGLLEIVAGELETGVTRFIAVSVKTFVLCLGAGFGMLLTLDDSHGKWVAQEDRCGRLDLKAAWWRIPLYLLCSASALGQYRFPIVDYWRGLVVQLVAYEVQYRLLVFFAERHDRDNMDLAASNVVGAAAAVCAACVLSFVVDHLFRRPYYDRILHRGGAETRLQTTVYRFTACCVRVGDCLGLGRATEPAKIAMAERLKGRLDGADAEDVVLEGAEEMVLIEAIVGAQDLNVWAMLMPAVYQLVPGSMIAKLWFNSLFPPALELVDDESEDLALLSDSVFSNLMVISTSLALGLILGFAFVSVAARFLFWLCCCRGRPCASDAADGDDTPAAAAAAADGAGSRESYARGGRDDRFAGMFTAPNEDPEDGAVAAQPKSA